MSGYTPKPTPLFFEQSQSDYAAWMNSVSTYGGWNPETKVLTPIAFGAEAGLEVTQHALDSIAASIEAGVLSSDCFPKAAFESPHDFERFRESLYGYGESFWMNDRYFWAFMHLEFDEHTARNFDVLADELEFDLAEDVWA